MQRFLLLLIVLMGGFVAVEAQTQKIDALKDEKAQIERGIQQSKQQLNKTKTEVKKGQKNVNILANKLQERLNYINQLEKDIERHNANISRLERELRELGVQLHDKREKYSNSLRYARYSPSFSNPVLFIFSGESFAQIFRRMRYAKEFAALQKQIGIQVIGKQNQARAKQNELLHEKQELNVAVQEVIKQRKILTEQHSIAQKDVAKLQKQQKTIEQEVAEQQKKLNALNKKIDELVAYEIEQARLRAEAEARKNGQPVPSTPITSGKKPSSGGKWLTAEDKQLNGNLEQNKGRLPVPLTGPYQIARRFGTNQISQHVTLDNKGTNYKGQSGARARSIFDGEVSAVFQLGNLKNVLIRHGSYISVYCNLSSVIVKRGQKVKARDIIGTIAADDKGEYVLHFQLRKETVKLNPEQWIGK